MEKKMQYGVLTLLVKLQTRLPILVNVHEPYYHTTPCSGEIIEPGGHVRARVLITQLFQPPKEWLIRNEPCGFKGYVIGENWWNPIRSISGSLEKGDCGTSTLIEREIQTTAATI